ncbi:dihydrofolate reductase [Lethenteron reissneri]|uniref:dihydrofolate reductase n=1 Tax=Lethenteron reissneri TaxID=7753 RepID=UPI002AB5FFDB|nr:dihydrofolate reductase [Lethenteron reissneri]XP_061428212.1 dihydrofolate reductase [Lethenteron reissneri]
MPGGRKYLDLIAAVTENMGIGMRGDLPWSPKHLKIDFDFFQTITAAAAEGKQNVVIMGRKTWFSIPEKKRPLKNRINIVLSRELKCLPEGAHYLAPDLNSALSLIDSTPAIQEKLDGVWILGGGGVYKEAMEHSACRRLFITRVLQTMEADAFFPDIDADKFKLLPGFPGVPEGMHENEGFRFHFEVYEAVDGKADA